MKITTFTSGIVQTNSYILTDLDDSASCIMVDCPDGNADALSFIRENGLRLTHILLTHGHFDHVLGLPHVKDEWPEAEIWMSRSDSYFLEDGAKGTLEFLESSFPPVASMFRSDIERMPQDLRFYEDEVLSFRVIETPGHTPGSVCLWSERDGVLFSGDTIFCRGYGRTDFPGGSDSEMASSLRKVLGGLPGETEVYPGHGPKTSIEEEKKFNRI